MFCLLIFICLNTFSQSVSESEFFIYEDGVQLPKEDDTHSEQIILSPEIPFITTKYESIYVSISILSCLQRKNLSLLFRKD